MKTICQSSTRRSGYSMVMVLVVIVLITAMSSLAWHYTGTVLRFESVRAVQADRDAGSKHALAQGLALLETGMPPSDPYECGTTLTIATGPKVFVVTFTSDGPDRWDVQSAPAGPDDNPPAMPSTF